MARSLWLHRDRFAASGLIVRSSNYTLYGDMSSLVMAGLLQAFSPLRSERQTEATWGRKWTIMEVVRAGEGRYCRPSLDRNVEGAMLLLHLSDLHFRKGEVDTAMDPNAHLRNELLRDAEAQCQRIGAVPEAVFISGDMAFGADPAEYGYALGWLDQLCERCCTKLASVFVVPGNHDVRSVYRLPKPDPKPSSGYQKRKSGCFGWHPSWASSGGGSRPPPL